MRHHNILLLVATLILGGCATIDHVPSQQSVIAFDFSEYTEQGFMITPQGYGGPYESIGMINMTISPEARRSEHQVDSSDLPSDEYLVGEWVIDRVTTGQLVEAAYQEAQAMGANAVIDFTVTNSTSAPATGLVLPEFNISGFAIRRIDE